MKAKIKIGAGIMHDQFFGKWPGCRPPISEYQGEKYQYRAKDPDMLFDVEWKSLPIGGYWNCIAPGYGKKGDYGNGSIFVHGIDGIEKMPEKMKVILQKSNTAEIRAISQYAAISDGIEVIYAENLGNYTRELREGAMPVGSVEFVTNVMQLLGVNPPEFNPYPSGFYYGRNIKKCAAYQIFLTNKITFIKPVQLKRFNGFIYRGMDYCYPGNHLINNEGFVYNGTSYWDYDDHDIEQLKQFLSFRLNEEIYISDVVNFLAEWRCYYHHGILITQPCRYDDNEEEYEIDESFLSSLSDNLKTETMAVDIGLLDNGKFCVVECNDAWAIGKYKGISNKHYFDFLSARWHDIISFK